MKKTVVILAVLLCSMAFSASVLAENDGIAATSSGKTVKMDFEKSRPLSVMLGETGMYYTVPTGTGDYREYTEMFTGGN